MLRNQTNKKSEERVPSLAVTYLSLHVTTGDGDPTVKQGNVTSSCHAWVTVTGKLAILAGAANREFELKFIFYFTTVTN